MVLLEILETDIFRICCLLPSTVSCSGGERFVSRCYDLIDRSSQKVLLWAMGIWGLFGNVLVMYMSFYRRYCNLVAWLLPGSTARDDSLVSWRTSRCVS